MDKPIDLNAVREARAELAKLASQHPEAFRLDRIRLLTENLEDYMTPAKTRLQAHRDRLKAHGKKRITVTLSQEAAQALTALKAAGYGRDYNEIVTTALLRLAIAAVNPVGSPKGHYVGPEECRE